MYSMFGGFGGDCETRGMIMPNMPLDKKALEYLKLLDVSAPGEPVLMGESGMCTQAHRGRFGGNKIHDNCFTTDLELIAATIGLNVVCGSDEGVAAIKKAFLNYKRLNKAMEQLVAFIIRPPYFDNIENPLPHTKERNKYDIARDCIFDYSKYDEDKMEVRPKVAYQDNAPFLWLAANGSFSLLHYLILFIGTNQNFKNSLKQTSDFNEIIPFCDHYIELHNQKKLVRHFENSGLAANFLTACKRVKAYVANLINPQNNNDDNEHESSTNSNNNTSKNKKCFSCSETKDLKVCQRCKKATYCSRKCQVSDWKNHKQNCSASNK